MLSYKSEPINREMQSRSNGIKKRTAFAHSRERILPLCSTEPLHTISRLFTAFQNQENRFEGIIEPKKKTFLNSEHKVHT